jgi:MSHA pilin protein MshC
MAYLTTQKGFTLVELVMTMLLLGILSATALPKFFSVSLYQQQVFFDDTLTAVRYAQKLAVATGCNVQVSITANTYTIKCPTNRTVCTSLSASDFNQSVNNPATGTPPYSNSQSGISLTASTTPFYFTALGTASTNVTLTVAGSQVFYVVATTGFVYE